MPDIKKMRLWFNIAFIVLGVICLASVGVLVSPIGRGSRSGGERIAHLQAQLRAEKSEMAPLSGIDNKVVEAGKQIGEFYDARLPAAYAAISERMNKVATENGVQLTTESYQSKPSTLPGLERLRLDATITGNYLQAVSFINALERDPMFFLIDGVSLGEPQAGVGIRLQIKVETYRKESLPAPAA
ncbi:MAG: GspMb/PilO family protein [Terriglobales bacterium]